MKIIEEFRAVFKHEPDFLVAAPGRINLIGEHTDYNLGYVLPAAIDKYIYFAFRKTPQTDNIRFYSIDMDAYFNGNTKEIMKSEDLWANYLLGIVDQVLKSFDGITGFECVFGGNIPIGSGLSSSAALECGFAFGLNHMFDLGLSRMDIAKMGQASENEFLGIKSGILDQFSSLFGKKEHCIKLDCRSMEYEYIPWDNENLCVTLINSNVKHTHLTSGYNDRANTCHNAASILNIKYGNINSLRDVSHDQLMASKDILDDVAFRRADFIIRENDRLLEFTHTLHQGPKSRLGDLLSETHHGLSLDYEVSCEETDLLVKLSDQYDNILGARMMGGGFGGCVILLSEHEVESEVNEIATAYLDATNIKPEIYHVQIVDGVKLLDA